MRRFSLLCWLILMIFFFVNFSSIALASEEFETVYNVRYEVDQQGVTHVSQEISLTNKLSNVYATRYALNLETSKIENVEAEDAKGPLNIQLEKQNKATTINLTFNDQVVGAGETLKFNLSYDAFDLATKNGQVWQINIPRLAETAQIDTYRLVLAVPKSFGEPAFITPNPVSQGSEKNFNLFYFNKEQLANTGGNAVFGRFQIFDFTLYYHLRNSEMFTAETDIALPPDTAYQQVFYKSIVPPPLNVRVDSDGNWLARFRLASKERLDIKASGKVKVFAQPQDYYLKPSRSVLNENLKADVYWETEDEEIKSRAKELANPREIYAYVIKSLEYDYSRVKENTERFGAKKALKKPHQAICTEFTDLFIALSRAAGIPAREINGYAYTTNERLRPLGLVADILHAWPEYWDQEKQVWVPVDPTWGDTTGGVDYFQKLDLSHFSFAIHGASSQMPFPAGSYKLENPIQKDIQVEFGQYETETAPQLKVIFDLPKRIFAGIEAQGKVKLENDGPGALYNLPIAVESDLNVSLSDQNLLVIPPFGSQELTLKLTNNDWLKTGPAILTLFVGEEKFVYDLRVDSLFWQQIVPITGGCLAGFVFFLAVYKIGYLFLQRRHRRRFDFKPKS
jgi:transglutaminase-like putative cysteine protease